MKYIVRCSVEGLYEAEVEADSEDEAERLKTYRRHTNIFERKGKG